MKPTGILISALVIAVVASVATFKVMTPHETAKPVVQQVSSSEQSIFERVKKSGVIHCGYTTWPPALSKDPNTGKLSGINYEVMEEIGKELDLKIEWTEEVGYGNYIEGLNNGRYDMICSTNWPDPARIRFQTFSRPYYFSPVYAYVREGDTRFDGNLDKINDPAIKIATIDGDISATAAKMDYPNAATYSLPQNADAAELFASVVTNKADVFFSDDGNFKMYDKSNPGKMRRVTNVAPSRVYGEFLVVKYGETQLRDMLNVAITQLINSGKIEKIIDRTAPGIYLVPEPDFKQAK